MSKLYWVLLMLFSCQSNNQFELSQKELIINKVISQTSHVLQKEKQLTLVGLGGSSIKGYEHVTISFNYYNFLNITQARELVLYAAETFLNNLNSDEKLNELVDKPYPMSWMEIEIFVYSDLNFTDIKYPDITVVLLKRNKITYMSKNDTNFEIIYEENYQEALDNLKTIKDQK